MKSLTIIALGLVGAAALARPGIAAEENTTLAVPAINLGFLTRYVAEEEGFWKKQGLNVKVQHIQGIGSMNAVIAGSVDFSMSSGPSITRANARGQKLTALATSISESDEYIVIRKEVAEAAHFNPNAPLAERVKALKGHTIADGGPGSVADLFMKTIMRIGGLAPSAVTLSSIGAFELIAAFQRRAIDGMSFSMPYSLEVAHSGDAVIIADGTKNEPKEFMPLAAGLLLTRPQLCTDHRSICEKMTHSMLLAVKFLLARRDDSIAILQKRFPKTDPAVVRASYEAVARMTNDPPAITTIALKNGDLMNEQAGFMKMEDALSSYDGLFTNEFLK